MTNAAPAGWYDDGSGRQRWWDGSAWQQYAPQPPAPTASKRESKRTANRMQVSYTREQKGHSLTWWILLSFCIVGIPGLIYYSASPNHYWHV